MRTLIQTIASAVFGAGIILALAMLFLAAWPLNVRAADDPACVSLTADVVAANATDPNGVLAIYAQTASRRFINAATAVVGPPPRELSSVTFVVTYEPSDPRARVHIHFYDSGPRGDCLFYVADFGRDTLAAILREMRDGSI